MYFSYKSSVSSCKQSNKSSQKNLQNIRTSLDNDNNSILNFDLKIGFTDKNPNEYNSIKQYLQSDIQKLESIKCKAQSRIKALKLGNNCKITQTEGIQNEDSDKLMNFVIGGYVQNDFDQYLSMKEFNQKKEDFQVLKQIYQEGLKVYNDRSKKINQENQSIKQRSLLSMIYLNENINKQTRTRIEEHMKQNKILW